MLIALEGGDGVGKSTLSYLLAKKIPAKLLSAPTRNYLKSRDRVDSKVSLQEHYDFYRNGIIEASVEIAHLLCNGDKIILDRYWLSTYTYHKLGGLTITEDDFSTVVQPTLTVLLQVDPVVQAARILHKDAGKVDHASLSKQIEIAAAFRKNVEDLRIPFILIDTLKHPPEECADIVIKAVTSSR
ncbi:MAG: AAA family ATPase [bacterium]|nr:AAA family ATPase [bacterium]